MTKLTDKQIIEERDSLIAENIDMYCMSETKAINYVRPRIINYLTVNGFTRPEAIEKWKELTK